MVQKMRDPEHEKMPREQIKKIQLQRLQAQVRIVYEKVPFYRQAFQKKGITPEDIQSLKDLTKLPFTSKLDFKSNYPLGFLAVPKDQVVRIHSSSGTTDKPTIAAYTRSDINTWSEILARGLATAGVTNKDIFQNAFGYGLFTGGMGYHYGVERLGAIVIPAAAGNTRRQITLMQDLGTTVLGCTPSYALIIGETAQELGIDLRKTTKLRLAVCGSEPSSEQMRKEIQDRLGVEVFPDYGLTEANGPGVSIECPQHDGMHIPEDHFIAEVVDPNTGEQLPEGQLGELVITTLTKEACPVIRFRTRDITSLTTEPCKCGRTLARMSRVGGRTDDMLKVRGVNVFPSQIENVLLKFDGVEPHYVIVVDRRESFSIKELEIWVEVNENIFSDEMQTMRNMEQRLRAHLESVLGISAKIKLVEPKTLARSEGKSKRVVDRSDLDKLK
jgi:phenylacetate-CoA ligase